MEVDTDNCLFQAKLDNVKNLSQILRAINFRESATCFLSVQGMKVVLEDSKCMQVSAFIGEELFQEYNLKTDMLMFLIGINVLVECLSIFDNCSTTPGAATALKMSCRNDGSPLQLLLDEGELVTECSIKTKRAMEVLDFDFPIRNELNKIIIRAAELKDILSDLDSGTEYVEITFSPDPPYFRITTKSVTTKSYIDIPKNSETVESFHSDGVLSYKYKYYQIKPAIKMLGASTKASIRINECGTMCIQFMIRTISKNTVYVEYMCSPLGLDDSDSED